MSRPAPGAEDQLVLVHECGEVFDDIHIAGIHADTCPDEVGLENSHTWSIMTRAEAF